MKRNLELFLTLLIGTVFGIVIHGTIQAHSQPQITEPEVITEYVYIEQEPEIVTEYVYIQQEPETNIPNLTFEEQELLEGISYAEARGEGVKGMALVMNVVINRANKTGQSIHDVIYATGQFYTAGMTKDVSEECHEALSLVMDGYDESEGAIYFSAHGYSQFGEPLFQYGRHYFSK